LESELTHNRQQLDLARKDQLEKMLQVGSVQGDIENLLDDLDTLENYDKKRAIAGLKALKNGLKEAKKKGEQWEVFHREGGVSHGQDDLKEIEEEIKEKKAQLKELRGY